MHVAIGTAGHIDHGKSTLVKALTGHGTDRLPEEKRRGITIELGFAPWQLRPGLDASVIDVPGHEGLVHTMVCGAWGLDVLLLVVAADEGVMPQTREHLSIARLLGIRGTVVALTKVDRVDADLLAMAADDVSAQLQALGMGQVPVVPCSAVTGQGLPELTAALIAVVEGLPARPVDGVPFLPVDRVFTVKGFGTVVTGTLSGGPLAVEDVLDLHPGPKGVRARGLQSHGKAVKQALPSWRVAVNLPNVAVDDVPRGSVLAPAHALTPSRRLDVRLQTLPEAPALRDHGTVTVHLGAAAVPARIRTVFATREEPLGVQPGEEKVLQLILQKELVCRPGQRFIVRGHRRLAGQGSTVGGGEVLDPHAPRRRRGRPETAQALEALTQNTLPLRLAQAVLDAGTAGADLPSLQRRLPWKDVRKALEDAVGRGHLKRVKINDQDVAWHPDALAAFMQRLTRALDAFHQAHPMLPAAPLEEVRTSLKVDGQALERPRFLALLKALKAADIVVEEDSVRLAAHRPRGVSPELLALVERLHADAGVAPPTRNELLPLTGATQDQVDDALKALVSSSALVRVKEDLHFARAPYGSLVQRTLAFVDEKGGITTQEFKDLMGVSRKFVIPFLEHLDDTRVTLRVGEKRVRRAR
jgi:selenocysteine-specific elongation factor